MAKTPPLLCCSIDLMAKTLPLPCCSSAVVTAILPSPCVSTALVAATPYFPCLPAAFVAAETLHFLAAPQDDTGAEPAVERLGSGSDYTVFLQCGAAPDVLTQR